MAIRSSGVSFLLYYDQAGAVLQAERRTGGLPVQADQATPESVAQLLAPFYQPLAEKIPLVSTITGIAYVILKGCVFPWMAESKIMASPLFERVQALSWGRCLTLCVPILGSILLHIADRSSFAPKEIVRKIQDTSLSAAERLQSLGDLQKETTEMRGLFGKVLWIQGRQMDFISSCPTTTVSPDPEYAEQGDTPGSPLAKPVEALRAARSLAEDWDKRGQELPFSEVQEGMRKYDYQLEAVKADPANALFWLHLGQSLPQGFSIMWEGNAFTEADCYRKVLELRGIQPSAVPEAVFKEASAELQALDAPTTRNPLRWLSDELLKVLLVAERKWGPL